MPYPTQAVQSAGVPTQPAATVVPAKVVPVVVTASPKRASVETAPAQPAIDVKELDQILKEVRANLVEGDANLQISVDQDTGKTIVRVIDEHTQEVIRQIPSEDLVAISRSLTKLEGNLLDTKV